MVSTASLKKSIQMADTIDAVESGDTIMANIEDIQNHLDQHWQKYLSFLDQYRASQDVLARYLSSVCSDLLRPSLYSTPC